MDFMTNNRLTDENDATNNIACSDNKITNRKIEIDTGLQCLVTIATYYGIHADEKQLRDSLGMGDEPVDESNILRMAGQLKIKAKKVDLQIRNLKKIPLPGIIKTKDNNYLLLIKVDEDKAVILYPDKLSPQVITIDELEVLWSGSIMLFIPRDKKKQNIKFGFRWFIPTVLKYKKSLFEVLIAALIMQLLTIFSPLITQSVIDKVLVHNNTLTLDVLAIALIMIIVFETILGISRSYVFTHTTSKIDVILSSRLFNHLFALPLRYFENRRVGDTIARLKELENIRRFLTGVPMITLIDALFIIIYIIIMFFYSTSLALIVLCSLPLLITVSAIATPMLKTRLDEKFHCGAEQQSFLVEAVNGIHTVKSFAIENVFRKKWEALLADYTTANFRTAMLSNVAGSVAQFIQKIFDVAVLYFGARLVIAGKMTVGQMVAFRMLSGRVSQPVLRLVQMWQEFQQTSLSVKRIGDIFNSKTEPKIDASKMSLPVIKGQIRFERVTFRYKADGCEAIKNITFQINPNMIIGIVGRSGSGKSTLTKLIQRLYFPESGRILIDGMDISLCDPEWLRKQIGVVLQENFLFNGTIRENIALQKPNASMEEIMRVAQVAGAHDFILELPEGYNTIVGERGTGLSGGQKQRIAIARALINDPKILIFDEATSALDYESERIIQNNLKQICKGRTVLIIAHRLSTVSDANAIMTIDHGQLIEYGPKEKLMQQKGLFYHLVQQQEK